MKYFVAVLCVVLGAHSLALAQGNPSGAGAVTGDPAASSAGKSTPVDGSAGKSSNSSGSGTSPSGGKDDNPDHGFGVLKDGMNNTKKK